jgi:hypothetical protein
VAAVILGALILGFTEFIMKKMLALPSALSTARRYSHLMLAPDGRILRARGSRASARRGAHGTEFAGCRVEVGDLHQQRRLREAAIDLAWVGSDILGDGPARRRSRPWCVGACLGIFAVFGMVESPKFAMAIPAVNESVFVLNAKNIVINSAAVEPDVALRANDALPLIGSHVRGLAFQFSGSWAL